jgi:hypothetical protein
MSTDGILPDPAPLVVGSSAALPFLAATASSGTSSATELSASQGGPGMVIHGGTELGSYYLAMYNATTPADATARFTVKPGTGAAFVYILRGTGSSYIKRQLRLERLPGSTTLQAAATTGVVACGSVASDKPTNVALVFHPASQTFDVLIGGAASACTALPTRMGAPVVGFSLMDASNEGYGGEVEFTALSLQ